MTDAPAPWVPGEAAADADARRHAPATLRNRDAIAAVLAEWLPPSGHVLEIASGSGEHIVYFARLFPVLRWIPSDPDPAALTSIAAWTADSALGNVAAPLRIDAADADWPAEQVAAVLCINMLHISPWASCAGLFAGASARLPSGAPLMIYGPFVEAGVSTARSNAEFDASLRARDAAWGLRDLADVTQVAADCGFALTQRVVMPANNLMLRYTRQ